MWDVFFLGWNEEKSPEIAFGVVGLPLCACKPKTVVTMTLHSPRTLLGLLVHPTCGFAFSVERLCLAFVVLLHTCVYMQIYAHTSKEPLSKRILSVLERLHDKNTLPLITAFWYKLHDSYPLPLCVTAGARCPTVSHLSVDGGILGITGG